MKKSLVRSLLWLVLIAAPVLAEDIRVGPFLFDNPLGPPQFTELSEDALSLTWPTGASYDEVQTEMMVVVQSAQKVATIKDGGGDAYRAALASHLALTGEPETINKTLFFGSTAARTVYQSAVPRTHEAHVFHTTLPDGSLLILGVRFFDEITPVGGDLLRNIGNTFRLAE